MKTLITSKKAVLAMGAALIAVAAGCTSVEEIQRKADAGDKEMQYDLAIRYREGDGIPLNKEKADEYLKKSSENGYIPAACEIAKEIHEKRNIEESEKLMKCYDVIFGSSPLDVSSIIAQKKFSYSFPKMSVAYYVQLVEENKEAEAIKYKKCVLRYLTNEYCSTTDNIESYRRTLQQHMTETEKKEEEQRKSTQNLDEKSANKISRDGIKLFKSIYSGLSVKELLQSFERDNSLMMNFICAMKRDEEGIVYLIHAEGEGKEVSFLACLNDTIRDYYTGVIRDSIGKGSEYDLVGEKAPASFLFGVIYWFGDEVTVENLENKIKKDFPEVAENPEQKQTNEPRAYRQIDYDCKDITNAKSWESERIRATIHFRNGGKKILIIVDKMLESEIQKIAKEVKQKHSEESEKTRKKAEQKALDF